MNEFINELDLPVNKVLNNGKNQEIASQKNQDKRNQTGDPAFMDDKEPKTDRCGKYQSSKRRQLFGRKVFLCHASQQYNL
jgi:hypothetical protein